jgi:hypothetical protein
MSSRVVRGVAGAEVVRGQRCCWAKESLGTVDALGGGDARAENAIEDDDVRSRFGERVEM